MANRYKVPKKQWRKWCDLSRRVFNDMYDMLKSGSPALGPVLDAAPTKSLRVVAWNAAWLAADATESNLRAIAKGV